jgi:hypothetical protein
MNRTPVDHIISQFDFNLRYTKELVKDITDDQMTVIPFKGLENHPSFTLGHLVTAKAMLNEDLGGEYEIPEGWTELFQRKGPGDPRYPEINTSQYPSKSALLDELELQHQKVISKLKKIDLSMLDEKVEWRFDKYFPSMMDIVMFFCINHYAMHISQLAAWRRAMKLPSALANM